MQLSNCYRSSLIAVVLVSMSLAKDMTFGDRQFQGNDYVSPLRAADDSSRWENILREYLFKTISPPSSNNLLYKNLLEAQFYRSEFPTELDTRFDILSSGNVYRLPDGQWILCQDGCTDCEICSEQKYPKVKWALKKIKRSSQLGKSRHDLQLTILPQIDDSIHSRNKNWRRPHVYVTSHSDVSTEFPDDFNNQPVKKFESDPFGTTVSDDDVESVDRRTPMDIANYRRINFDDTRGGPLALGRKLSPTARSFPIRNQEAAQEDDLQPKRNAYLEELRPNGQKISRRLSPDPSTSSYPAVEVSNSSRRWGIDSSIVNQLSTEARLILGSDQFGDKHLVHVVPASDLEASLQNGAARSRSRTDVSCLPPETTESVFMDQSKLLRTNKFDSVPDEMTKINAYSTYSKLVKRVLDSLNLHKNEIASFLSSQNTEQPAVDSGIYRYSRRNDGSDISQKSSEAHLHFENLDDEDPRRFNYVRSTMNYPSDPDNAFNYPQEDSSYVKDRLEPVYYPHIPPSNHDGVNHNQNRYDDHLHDQNTQQNQHIPGQRYLRNDNLHPEHRRRVEQNYFQKTYPHQRRNYDESQHELTKLEKRAYDRNTPTADESMKTGQKSYVYRQSNGLASLSMIKMKNPPSSNHSRAIPRQTTVKQRDENTEQGNDRSSVTTQISIAAETTTEDYNLVMTKLGEYNNHLQQLSDMANKYNPWKFPQASKQTNASEIMLLKGSIVKHSEESDGALKNTTFLEGSHEATTNVSAHAHKSKEY